MDNTNYLKPPSIRLPDAESMVAFSEPGDNKNLSDEVEERSDALPSEMPPSLSLKEIGYDEP